MNGPNTISCLVDREVTLLVGDDGRIYPSHPERVADILPDLKQHRALAMEYAKGEYFPSTLALIAEIEEAERPFEYIDARYPLWVVVEAMVRRRVFRTPRATYGLREK